jgi:hypothetical protein
VAGERDIRAGGAFVEIGLRDRIGRGLANIQARLRALGGFASGLGNRFALLGAGLATGLAATAKHFADVGSEIYDMSQRTGASAELLSELGFALEQSGGSAADLEKALRQSTLLLQDAASGNKTAAKTFEDLGLSVDQLLAMNADDRFAAIAKAVGGMGDEVQRTAALAALFGARSGTKFAELLSGDLGAARAEAARQGATITGQQAEQADALGDALGNARKGIQSLVLAIGSGLAPVLTQLVAPIGQNVAAISAWVKENRAVVLLALAAVPALFGLALAFKALGIAVTLTAALIGVVATAVGVVIGVLTTVMTVLSAVTTVMGALQLVLVAVAGVLAYFAVQAVASTSAADQLGSAFKAIGTIFATAWQGVRDALAAGDIELALQIAGKALEAVWVQITTRLKVIWFEFLKEIYQRLEKLKAFGKGAIFGGVGTPSQEEIFGPAHEAGVAALKARQAGERERKALADEVAALAARARKAREAGDAARAAADEERAKALQIGKGVLGTFLLAALPRLAAARKATEQAAIDQQARGGFTQQAAGAFAFGGTLKQQLDVEKDQLRVLEQIEAKVGPTKFG